MKKDNGYNISLFLLGFVTMPVQIILLREFMVVFGGNELIIGILLADWLILTATGAFLAGRFSKSTKECPSHPPHPPVIPLDNPTNLNLNLNLNFFPILPLLTFILLYLLRPVIFPPGAMVSLPAIWLLTALLLLPFCLLSGWLFTRLAGHLSSLKRENFTGRAYALESVGSILGGALFSFVLVFFFDGYWSLVIIALTTWLVLMIMNLLNNGWKKAILALSLMILTVASSVWFSLPRSVQQELFPGQTLVFAKDSPYGKVVVTKNDGQVNLFYNGIPVYHSDQQMQDEESVHYALLQRQNPEQVLAISGGLKGITEQILKYPSIRHVDYVEIDPWLVRSEMTYLGSVEGDKVQVSFMDARRFLSTVTTYYDMILVNLPEPLSAQVNRCYTYEFFLKAREHLHPGGVLCTALPATTNYIGGASMTANATLFKTLQQVFPNVLIIPGGKNFFLASDSLLTGAIGRIAELRGISNDYVNQYYMDDASIVSRGAYILEQLNTTSPVNRDDRPVSYLSQLQYWMSYFNLNLTWILLGIAGLFLLFFIMLNPIRLGLFTAGFVTAGAEYILILAIQVFFGYAYFLMGIIFVLFMTGLALGAMFGKSIFAGDKHLLNWLVFGTGVFTLMMSALIRVPGLAGAGSLLVAAVFSLLVLCLAFLMGTVFSHGSVLYRGRYEKVSGDAYSADLIGSAFGLMILSMVLVPLLGLRLSCLVMSLVAFVAAARLSLDKNKL